MRFRLDLQRAGAALAAAEIAAAHAHRIRSPAVSSVDTNNAVVVLASEKAAFCR